MAILGSFATVRTQVPATPGFAAALAYVDALLAPGSAGHRSNSSWGLLIPDQHHLSTRGHQHRPTDQLGTLSSQAPDCQQR